MSYQLELFDKDDKQILDEAYEYFNYLQKPNEAFSDMPVCPFLKAELEKNNLHVDIWKPDEKSFYDFRLLFEIHHLYISKLENYFY